MVRRVGDDPRWLWKPDLVVAMEEEGANLCDRASTVQRDGPETSHVLTVGLLIFVHEPQRAGKRTGEGDASGGKPVAESLYEKI